jgi:hypothetical protein
VKKILGCFCLLFILIGLVACQDNQETSIETANATATAQGIFLSIPEDVPVMENATEIRVSSSGNSISYRVQARFEDVIKYYQEQSIAMGWEQLGGEQIMMDSITMQRQKPDKNMSILISAVQDSGEVLVRLMIASK